MSQKLLYRTACFIFGFGIGVIYFTSPTSNHQRAEADAFRPQNVEVPGAANSPALAVPTVSDLKSLELEENHLEELEAELLARLSEDNNAVVAETTTADAGITIVEDVVPQAPAIPVEESPVDEKVVEDSFVANTEPNEQDLSDGAENSVVLSSVTSIEQDENVPPTEKKSFPRAMPRPDIHARAQLRHTPPRLPGKITRKILIYNDDGSAADERILEIDVASSIPEANMVPFSFTDSPRYSKLQSQTAPAVQPVAVPVAAVAEPVEQPQNRSPDGTVLAREVTDLKQENLDLREQLLSLKVVVQAMEDEALPTVATETASFDSGIESPQLLSVAKTPAKFWAPDQELQYPAATPVTNGFRQPRGDFESQPGDPVLVRYDRTPLRTGPGTNYSRVAVLGEGTVLTVDYHRQGWFRVYTQDGVRAWIAQDAIRWF